MDTRVFTPFPILTTERLTLRQLLPSDEQGIFALRSDAEINKYLGREPSKTIDDARNFIRKIAEAVSNNQSLYWAITLSENGLFVGTICLYEFSDDHKKCEIGYELLAGFQGMGIMQEAAGKVLAYAVETINLDTIEAFTHKDNGASAKLLERLRFKKSGEFEDATLDCYVFAQ
jgi:ribosomal-protein-alanine N-acetyltransferase